MQPYLWFKQAVFSSENPKSLGSKAVPDWLEATATEVKKLINSPKTHCFSTQGRLLSHYLVEESMPGYVVAQTQITLLSRQFCCEHTSVSLFLTVCV